MKCLTHAAFQSLLDKQAASLNKNGQIEFPKSNHSLMVSMPEQVSQLNFLSLYLANWLVNENDAVIYLSNWGQTDLAHPVVIFEKLRQAYGETRPILEAPAHLFRLSEKAERDAMAGIIFLAMANDWDAYLVPLLTNSYLYVSDAVVLFSAATKSKIDEALQIAADFKLRTLSQKG